MRYRAIRPGLGKVARCVLALAGLWLTATPCAGQTHPARPMTFTTDADTEANRAIHRRFDGGDRPIYAAGDITPGTAARFVAFVKTGNFHRARVLFNSSGGSFAEGVELGKAISALGLGTDVRAEAKGAPSTCVNACAYAYVGGGARFLSPASGRLGIRQLYDTARASMAGQAGQPGPAFLDYLSARGVDTTTLSVVLARTQEAILWLKPEMAADLQIVNNGVTPAKAELIKPEGMPQMLQVEQQRYDTGVLMDFACAPGQMLLSANVITYQEAMDEYAKRSIVGAYLFMDGRKVMQESGEKAAHISGDMVTLVRHVPADVAAAMLATDYVDVLIATDRDDPWGSRIDLSAVHSKMLDFFAKCAAVRPLEGAPSGGGRDLVIDGRYWTPTDRSMGMIDRASIRHFGTIVTAVTYMAARVGTVEYLTVSADKVDCVTGEGTSTVVENDRSGKPLHSAKLTLDRNHPEAALVRRFACGNQDEGTARVLGDQDPVPIMEQFIDSKADNYP